MIFMKSLRELIIEKINTDEIITVDNLEVHFSTPSGNLLIQVPDNYNEDNIQLYLDDRCLNDMPSGEDFSSELFGETNANNIEDAYFTYKNLTVPEDATVKPELQWDKKFDNNSNKNANLMTYSLDDFEYVITFSEFSLNEDSSLEVDKVLEKVFTAVGSNKEHPWSVEIKLQQIKYK